jgi:SpoVK/Ycf46/Vps4 family AAA+-type ATPase
VVGLLQDEVDPMVSVMKVEKAPLESYADIGGLDAQIQEIEAVELPLTHPELYEVLSLPLLFSLSVFLCFFVWSLLWGLLLASSMAESSRCFHCCCFGL